MVSSGVGLQEERGDKIVVESFHFDKSYLEEEKKEQERLAKREFRNLIIKSSVLGIVTLIVLLFTLSMIRHTHLIRQTTKKIEETRERIPKVVEAPSIVKEEVLSEERKAVSIEEMRRQIEGLAQKSPEKIAKLIKVLVKG